MAVQREVSCHASEPPYHPESRRARVLPRLGRRSIVEAVCPGGGSHRPLRGRTARCLHSRRDLPPGWAAGQPHVAATGADAARRGGCADRGRPRSRHAAQVRVFGGIFGELAEKFEAFVEALGEISDLGRSYTSADVLRLYELWVRTGSPRADRRLRELGIEPVTGSVSRLAH